MQFGRVECFNNTPTDSRSKPGRANHGHWTNGEESVELDYQFTKAKERAIANAQPPFA